VVTVLVGFVPNPLGEAALTAAVAEARRRSEALLVLNMSRDDVLVDAHRAGAEQLERVRRDLADLDLDFEVRQEEHGSDAADVLLEVAEREDVSVIVIGLRHRSPVGKLLLGSSAQRILLDASCPVLAVKAG
jgi:nucleotide-binding universal stress UspA family protein